MVIAGGWKLGRTIGSGATATVSLATACSSGELFAVKSSPITRSALLQREQSILCSLSSPHIISCLGSDVSADSYHLFLEFAAGGAISELAGLVGEPKIRSFTRQILLALCYLHSNGFAHCDVKGRNVLLGSDGRVMLGDFGSARRVEGNEYFSCVMGTPAFMAPEVARGDEQGFSGDIWSMGCTVVEMATGGSPWPEVTDAVSALYRIGFTSDVPIIPAWLSEEGKDFVSKCLIRDPKQRWTAKQLLNHPFVSEQELPPLLFSSEKQGRWVSPKSTLDFSLWESEAENEEEEDKEWSIEQESFSERIQQLSSPAPADWTWSQSWMPVRSVNEEEKGQNAIAAEEEASSSGRDSMESEEELALSSFSSEAEAENRADQTAISCDSYCTVKGTEPKTFLWIPLIVYFFSKLTNFITKKALFL